MQLRFEYKKHACVGEACWIKQATHTFDEKDYISEEWDPPAEEGEDAYAISSLSNTTCSAELRPNIAPCTACIRMGSGPR